MPGSITLNAPSYLPALVGSTLRGSSLLASLTANTPANLDPAPAPERAKIADASPASASGAQVQSDIAQFRQALAAAKTPAELFADATALKVLLTANGLADQAGNSAVATRALMSNPARSNSLLNQLKDSRWVRVNKSYSFATKGLSALKDPAAIAAITRSYADALAGTGQDGTPVSTAETD